MVNNFLEIELIGAVTVYVFIFFYFFMKTTSDWD